VNSAPAPCVKKGFVTRYALLRFFCDCGQFNNYLLKREILAKDQYYKTFFNHKSHLGIIS